MSSEPFAVVHYINQFFGGLGGEEHADAPLEFREGPVGPGQLFEQNFERRAHIAHTIVCGDNYFSEHQPECVARITEKLAEWRPHVLVAGPAFTAGRYGLACGRVCTEAERLGIPAVTGMNEQNPGVDVYLAERIYAIKTAGSVGGIREAVKKMAALALRRAGREPVGPAAVEGYFPRGIRRTVITSRQAGLRALDMLTAKLNGQPYVSELSVETYDQVDAPPPLRDLQEATLAIVSEGGVVPRGNPDHIQSAAATRFGRYSLAALDRLVPGEWDVVHAGIDNRVGLENPNRIVPLDILRQLEREGRFARLHETLYITVGNGGSVEVMRGIGRTIAEELRAAGVTAVLLTAT